MRFQKRVFSLIGLSFVMCVGAHAQTNNKWYAGAEFGVTSIKDNSSDIANSLTSVLGGTANVGRDTNTSATRLYGGYNFNNYIAAEIGYLQSSDNKTRISGTSGGLTPYTGSGTVSISGADISAIFRPNPNRNFGSGLFLRAGISSYTTKTSVTIASGGSSFSQSGSDSGSGANIGIGYDIPAGPGNVRVAYTNMSNLSGKSNNSVDAFSIGYQLNF